MRVILINPWPPAVMRKVRDRTRARGWERALRLPRATTPDLEVRRGLSVEMPDGVRLIADLYRPRGAAPMPTVLVRTPYGRRGLVATLSSRLLAEHGLQVLLQSCRGTFGSGGALDPFRERDDGLATLKWIRDQPWHSGQLGTLGASYLGISQWALAKDAGPDLAVMAIAASTSDPHDQTYHGDSYSLELALSWAYIATVQEQRFAEIQQMLMRGRLRKAADVWPLSRTDRSLLGKTVPYYQDWLRHSGPNDPYWNDRTFGAGVKDIEAAVDLVAGWDDIFLPGQLADYRRLRDAGRTVRLTVGPWTHFSVGFAAESTRRAIAVLRGHLIDGTGMPPGPPVRVFVTGVQQWRDLPDWPPPDMAVERWHLHERAGLSPESPASSPPARYRYDPARPTPALGGPGPGKARVDNAVLEARPDVLTFTSATQRAPLEVIGPVSAHIYLQSSRNHADLFVRLCDVDERGVSTNVCDGIQRVSADRLPPSDDGTHRVEVELWPTAHRFAAGHRLRVQISSGAHPRFARNPGTGAQLHEDSELLAADQQIFHDPEHPSAILLPMRKPS
jgi:uncharacterized protein